MTTPYFRFTFNNGTPGDIVDVYSDATGEHLTSGSVDAGGQCIVSYPAIHGLASALTRRVPTANPWQASTTVSAGDLVSSSHFGGWMLRCAIDGTTGSTEPTDANRLPGQVHRPFYVGKTLASIGRIDRSYAGAYGYTGIFNNTEYDGNPNTWYANLVEGAVTTKAVFGLLSDGTVNFQSYTSASDDDAAYADCQALSDIVKIWPYAAGIVALDTSGKLHHVCANNRSTHKTPLDSLLSNNPTAVSFLAGAEAADEATVILANGTAVSNSTTINNRLSGMTGIEAGAQTAASHFVLVCDSSTRVRGWKHDGAIDYTGATCGGDADPFDEVVADYGALMAITRVGDAAFWLASSDTVDSAEQRLGYMNGRPTELYRGAPGWAGSADNHGAYLYTPDSALGIAKPEGFGTSIKARRNRRRDLPYWLGGEPIIRDGGVTWHLVEPSTPRTAIALVPESFDANVVIPDGQLQGTLSVNADPAERPVLVIGNDPGSGAARVLSAGSSAADGTFSMILPGHTDPVFVLALDDAGPPWGASASYSVGDRVIPSAANHTGLVYACSVAGASDTAEPTWPTVIGGTVTDGAATWVAVNYYQPQAHGPVYPQVLNAPDDIDENGNTYRYQTLTQIEDVWLQVFADENDSQALIYRRLAPPADIEDNGTWEYARTLSAAAWWIDEYTLSTDAAQSIYRGLDGEPMGAGSYFSGPFYLPLINYDFEDGLTGWTVTEGDMKTRTSNPSPDVGTKYIYGGSVPDSRIEQGVHFIDDLGQPPELLAGRTMTLYFLQSAWSGADEGQGTLTFYDADDTLTGSASTTLDNMPVDGSGLGLWHHRDVSTPIPVGSVRVVIEFYAHRRQGTANNANFDHIHVRVD